MASLKWTSHELFFDSFVSIVAMVMLYTRNTQYCVMLFAFSEGKSKRPRQWKTVRACHRRNDSNIECFRIEWLPVNKASSLGRDGQLYRWNVHVRAGIVMSRSVQSGMFRRTFVEVNVVSNEAN